MKKIASVVKSGSALIVDCQCGRKHQVEQDKETKAVSIRTIYEPKPADDLDYMFEKEDETGEGEEE